MNGITQRTARALATVAVALAFAAPAAAHSLASPGAVFTATNGADGNAVLAFRRGARGALTPLGTFATGGKGTGTGLGNQSAVTLDEEGRHLFVVNAGSDSVSVFHVGRRGLSLVDVAPSGGVRPISITTYGDLVYVLNAGGDGNISGLEISPHGRLSPLPGSTRSLGGSGTGPAQIAFRPDGRWLVVSEKATSTIVTYRVGDDGLPGSPVVTPASGVTPFGFSFGHRGRLLVSEATGGAPDASTVSSYDVLEDGTLSPITSALPTTESAACWLVTTGNGRYAYVSNTGSDTVTGVRVARDGSLSLLEEDGVTAQAGDAPIDAALSRNGRYLYVLNGAEGSLSAFLVMANGALVPFEGVDGLPAGTNGLAAR